MKNQSECAGARIAFLTRSSPDIGGFGGNHRSYQIYSDLIEAFGSANVLCIDLEKWRPKDSPPSVPLAIRALYKLASWIPGSGAKLRRLVAWPGRFKLNPMKWKYDSGYSPYSGEYLDARLDNYVKKALDANPSLEVLVFDDIRFLASLASLKSVKLKTVAVPQNFESLDFAGAGHLREPFALESTGLDFASEVRYALSCDDRLLISKVETGLLQGLGLPGSYYPYRPVGRLRERLLKIADLRKNLFPKDRQVFLMVGTVEHPTTRASFQWFLENARQHGLPPEVELILAGSGTEKLDCRSISGVSARGRISEDDLQSLLISVAGIIAIQTCGFGALTKITELACAGVPVLTSVLTSYTQDLPPGCVALDKSWQAWARALSSPPSAADGQSYFKWEQTQNSPLASSVFKLLKTK